MLQACGERLRGQQEGGHFSPMEQQQRAWSSRLRGGACTAVSYSPGREGLQRRAALPYKYPESRVHSSVGDPLLQEGLPKGLRKALLLWGARCTQPDGVWGSHVSASRTHGWK